MPAAGDEKAREKYLAQLLPLHELLVAAMKMKQTTDAKWTQKGRELVDRFLERGHTVLGCGRSADHIDDLAAKFGAPHDFSAVDVSDGPAVDAWAARVLAANLAPDLIINNAALMNDPAPLWEVPPAEFDKLMAVNVTGTLNVIRAFAPAMISAGRGVIANLSSGWGRATDALVGPYCASKHAIEGLTRAMAVELAPDNIRVNALCPVAGDTPITRGFNISVKRFSCIDL